MKVLDCLACDQGETISVEIQPPRLGNSRDDIMAQLDPLVELGIRWVDITYHASQIVDYIQMKHHRFPLYQRLHPGTSGIAGAIIGRYSDRDVFPVPHVICTGFTKYDTEDFLHELACLGIFNVFAVRGDSAKDETGTPLPFEPVPGGFSHAYQLIQQIRGLRHGKYQGAATGERLDFEIGGACYPEGYLDCHDIDREIDFLKVKADEGADYFITQLFFDNDHYERYRDRVAAKGISQPIIPGLKPLTTYRHLEVLPRIFGCKLPEELVARVEKHKEEPAAIREIGIEWCVKQSLDLKKMGAPSLHYYAARNAPIREVIAAVRGSSGSMRETRSRTAEVLKTEVY